VAPLRTRTGTRLRVWLQRAALDRRIAEGEDLEAAPDLRLRAEQLVSPRSRRELACGIDRLIEEAEHPPSGLSARAPFRREAVGDLRAQLRGLAADLRAGRPACARGVALTRLLLTESGSPLHTSPLHVRCGGEVLEGAIEEARSAMSRPAGGGDGAQR
jgi:hypothetical protein